VAFNDGVTIHYFQGPIRKLNACGVHGAVMKLILLSTESKISKEDALSVSDTT
jgi:hypothetical protein